MKSPPPPHPAPHPPHNNDVHMFHGSPNIWGDHTLETFGGQFRTPASRPSRGNRCLPMSPRAFCWRWAWIVGGECVGCNGRYIATGGGVHSGASCHCGQSEVPGTEMQPRSPQLSLKPPICRLPHKHILWWCPHKMCLICRCNTIKHSKLYRRQRVAFLAC